MATKHQGVKQPKDAESDDSPVSKTRTGFYMTDDLGTQLDEIEFLEKRLNGKRVPRTRIIEEELMVGFSRRLKRLRSIEARRATA